jgi:uncharacterized membrane protein (DUF2068 family)
MSFHDGATRMLRGIAGFEAIKGVVALAVVLGLLGLLHHDLHHAAATLGPLLLAATGYIVLRFTEAYGLWHARPWGERLGAWSGALYLPFEGQHLIHRPGALSALVLFTNLALVAFLVWRLRCRVRARHPRDAAIR